MLRNYIKSAWRNLSRTKGFSAINILGLAVGMAVTMLIGFWIWDEVSYDRYHQNYDSLGQAMITQTFNGETGTSNAVAIPLADELKSKHGSEIKAISLASWNFGHILSVGDKKMISAEGMWVEPAFPQMFSLKALEGNVKDGLQDPSSILLNASTARALFGNESAIDKVIRLDNRDNYKVAGVYEDLPANSTLAATHILMAWDKYLTTQGWLSRAREQWDNHSFQLYVQANDGIALSDLTKRIEHISAPHIDSTRNLDEAHLILAMKDWRLRNEFKNGKQSGGRIEFVWMFGIIGVFVLFLACINFMNLSTARSEKRAREIGIRKTIGSLRGQIIRQFLAESVLVAFLALALALLLTLAAIPLFNSISGKTIHLPAAEPGFWALVIGFALLTGLMSGSYPAFYLSAFQPVKVLKGTFRVGKAAALPRKVLVVLQFSISVALIIGTIIVFKQIQFAKNKPIGYTREGLLTIDMTTPDLYGHYDALRRDLIETGVVDNMAESSSPSTGVWSNQVGFSWEGKDPTSEPLFGTIGVTHDFGATIGWKIREGRDFSREFADSSALIINEAAARVIGLKDIVGRTIRKDDDEFTVVGVVDDLIMESPYEPVRPTIFTLDPDWANVVTVRVKPSVAMSAALPKIEAVFKKYNPSSPFEYRFNDEEYALQFQNEERVGRLASFFAVFAIFISCLGLFGLASFVAEQRTKEIGVRKVLGASLFNVWRMLSRDFVLLVAISCLIAMPLAWYFLHGWLQRYTYRTDISWWVFAIACGGALGITLLTVSYQAIKAALTNPIRSLRSE